MMLKSIELHINYGGNNSLVLAQVYNNLSSVYQMTCDFENSKIYLEKSLQIKLNLLGEFNKDTVVGYNNLGQTYLKLEMY